MKKLFFLLQLLSLACFWQEKQLARFEVINPINKDFEKIGRKQKSLLAVCIKLTVMLKPTVAFFLFFLASVCASAQGKT